jgi:hypothetical protein
MTINLDYTFLLKCTGEPLTLYIAADSQYQAEILRIPISGNDWSVPSCQHRYKRCWLQYFVHNVETPVTLNITAFNLIAAGHVNCDGNPGAVIYAVTSNDSLCTGNYIYNPDACQCELGSLLMSGCLTINSYPLMYLMDTLKTSYTTSTIIL